MPDIVLIAPGSPDPRHRDGVEQLVDAVRDRVRSGRGVGACYLGHHGPTPSELSAELGRAAVAIPLLLDPRDRHASALPGAARELAAAGADVQLRPTLGPDPRLFDACEELLAAAGIVPDPATAVVLVGPAEGRNLASVEEPATAHRLGWGPWALAAVDGAEPLEAVVAHVRGLADRVVGVSFVVSEDRDHDRMAARCDALDIPMVAGGLSQTGALAHLVIARAAQDARLSA
ncbi:sirohydrochlorin chelatase [Tessaracoccus lapidicaptus]|uniref:sirohydrochlorin chelatase n=1 Tax=Tessaracoccus lapidicaptus TaxID=1427523 RepID=UPI0033419F96